ncbi:hypothetical protein Hanom_Chr12g01110261 [Helianthus anomalus]
MLNAHNSTTHHHHNHHHHDSSKKILKEKPHKLHDTPPYYDIFFNGNGFERFSNQPQTNSNTPPYYDILFNGNGFERQSSRPQTNARVANYYGHMHKYGFMQDEEDIDAEAKDFIESRHKKFELSKTPL